MRDINGRNLQFEQINPKADPADLSGLEALCDSLLYEIYERDHHQQLLAKVNAELAKRVPRPLHLQLNKAAVEFCTKIDVE